jgi:TetR/AcrR family transcriptional regulator, regulator of cefoperazone and chloramphenicol sensitivity
MTDDTPTRVLHAAGPIFAEKGYESATIREICTAAEVNVASVNYHFGDKETLYHKTVKLAHSLRLQQVPPPAWPEDTAPEEKLHQFVQVMLSRMLGTRDLGWQTQLMVREMIEPTAACQNIVEEFIRPQLNHLLEILNELLPQNIDEQTRYQLAFSIVGQCLHYRVAREFVAMLIPEGKSQTHYGIDELTQHITRFSLAGLRAGYCSPKSNF